MSRKVISFVKLYNRIHSKRTVEKMFAQQQRSNNMKRLRKDIKENQQIFFNTFINLKKKSD